jgi:cytochrome c oxidase subunit 3
LSETHSALAHHFDTIEQQREAASLGMWVFLVTEIMFFGGMFTAYVAYRVAYPGAFAQGSSHLNLLLGGINTAVLIGSSLTMAQLFFSLYFAMTGMHALHMIIGIGLLTFLVVQASRGRFSPEYYSPVEMTGLYWHFVDIVWIFLFPLLYLIDRHTH